jgi:hypothetical protein
LQQNGYALLCRLWFHISIVLLPYQTWRLACRNLSHHAMNEKITTDKQNTRLSLEQHIARALKKNEFRKATKYQMLHASQTSAKV